MNRVIVFLSLWLLAGPALAICPSTPADCPPATYNSLRIGPATGGFQGLGSVNAESYYLNGAPFTGSSVTWPATADIVLSNSTNSPAGLAPINGDCVVGSGGLWVAAACPGGGGISGPGTTVNGFVPLWNGTTGTALSAGLAVGLTGNSTIVETTTGGLLTSSLIPAINLAASGAGGVTGVLPAANGGTGVANAHTITTSLNFAITGSGNQTFFFGNTGTPWTYNFPQVTANLGYQVGSITSGDCLQASGTAGGFSDAGAVCGSGGTGITTLTGDVTAGPGSGSQASTLATVNSNVGSFTNANITVNAKGLVTAAANGSGGGSVSFTAATPDLVFTPSPATGTATLGTTVPLNTQSGASYAILTGDNTKLIEMTNASATTMTIPVANSTGFLSGWGTSIVPTLAQTALTPASGTVCGQASLPLDATQFVSLGAGASTNYDCAIGFPAVVPSGTIASGKNLGLDSGGHIVVATVSGGSSAFSALTSATNTTAAMVVGTGASLAASGSGTVTATAAPVSGLSGAGSNVVTALGNALSAAGGVTSTIAAGTSALGTGAISSAACATAVTTTATNTATTDVISWGFNGDPTGVTGYAPVTTGALTIFAYPSSNNVNFKVCNLTTASVTPGAITLNWRVVR